MDICFNHLQLGLVHHQQSRQGTDYHPGFGISGEGTTYLSRCVIRGGLRLAPWLQNEGRAAPTSPNCGIRRGLCWLRGFVIGGGTAWFQGCGIRRKAPGWWPSPEALPRASQAPAQAPGRQLAAPAALHTPALLQLPALPNPEAADHSAGVSRARYGRGTQGGAPRALSLDPGGHIPYVHPSLPRGGRGSVKSPASLPAGCAPPVPAPALHLEPVRLPSLSGAWNMSPAAQRLLAGRATVPARPRATRGPPTCAYWMAPTPVTAPQPIAAPDPAPAPKTQSFGEAHAELAANWWEQVPLKASNAGTGQQAGSGRAVPSWAGCTTPATCPDHRSSSRCGIVSWARAGVTRLQPGGTGRGAGAGNPNKRSREREEQGKV